MPARRNGWMPTVMMIVPMLAVPTMAIFGIPQFSEWFVLPTTSVAEDDWPDFQEPRVGHSEQAPGREIDFVKAEPIDIFRPYEPATASSGSGTEDVAQKQRELSWSDPLHVQRPATARANQRSPQDQAAMREASVKSARQLPQQVFDVFVNDFEPAGATTANAQPEDAASPQFEETTSSLESPFRSARQADLEVPTLTWREAVNRLNELGAKTYRLQAGVRPQEFRFVCIVESVEDARIARRFEAESRDALLAVEKVLAQVEAWHR